MNKLAVFYHARIAGGSRGIDPAFGLAMLEEQMDLLVSSKLYEACNEIVIGLNGSGASQVESASPPGVNIVEHGANAESLLPTYLLMEAFAKTHPDWFICFWHTKGVTHPNDRLNRVWRLCMERCVITRWTHCVRDLSTGADSAGAHWLTREQFGPMVNTFFWGGAFFWVRADFLNRLPKLPLTLSKPEHWFIPEMWIGSGPRPSVRDYAPHWPGIDACEANMRQLAR